MNALEPLRPLWHSCGKAQAAFQSDSDAKIDFLNDMLAAMDVHNNFWDHWDKDYKYSTDYDFVVPLQEGQSHLRQGGSEQTAHGRFRIEETSNRSLESDSAFMETAPAAGGLHRGQTGRAYVRTALRVNKG